MIKDYAEDLADCTLAEIEVAIREYRRDGENLFFPKVGQLRDIISANRKHRADLERLGPPVKDGDRRPSMWWMQSRAMWKPHWRETDVPYGEKVRDQQTGKLRDPERVVL